MPRLKLLNSFLGFSVFFILFTADTLPQIRQNHFECLTFEQGLPSNSINCVYQDKKGFIWLGTNNGLVRYDGYDYKVYRHDSKNINSISSNAVVSMLEDSTGNFWVGTLRGGLNKFDRYSNKFTTLRNIPGDPKSIHDNNVVSLYEDQGSLWAATWSGLSKLTFEDNKFINYFVNDVKDSNAALIDNQIKQLDNTHHSITSIIKDRDFLWAGTYNGLGELNTKNNSVIFYKYQESFAIRSLVNENENNLLVASDAGLFRFNKITKQFSSLLNFPINYILKTSDSRLWCASSGEGIILYDLHAGNTTVFNKGITNGIISNNYKHIFQDQAGTVWFTSGNDGINLLHKNYKIFTVYNSSSQNSGSLAYINKGFTGADNVSWIPAQGGGVGLLNRNNKYYSQYNDHILNKENVNLLYMDKTGGIWAGTNTGLFNQRLNIKQFDKINLNNYSIKDKPVTAITQDKEGNIWIGIYDNLVKYSPDNNETRVFNIKPDSISVVYSFNISGIICDTNILWITTSSGLFKYDLIKNACLFIKENGPSPVDNQIWSIIRDKKGLLWMGSFNDGLKCFNPAENKFSSYKTSNGLPSDNILSVLEDDDENLWLGTDRGLARFNPLTGNFIVYTTVDGLPGNQFLPDAAWISPTGEFWFATKSGIASFFPSDILCNKYVPPVVLTSFKIFNKEVDLNYEISYAQEIEIPYYQNVFSFTASALDYVDPGKNQYAFKLEGFNQAWTYTRSLREITYTNLDPGVYYLRIIGSNNDGIWNYSGLSIKIVILPPWYHTWWAYILFIIILIALYLAFKKYELKKFNNRNKLELKKLESEKLLEADKIKSDFFANISNEFRIPLTMIMEPAAELKERLPAPKDKKILELIEQNANRLLQLMNKMLDLSKLDSGNMKLQVSKNDFIPFISGIVMTFESEVKAKEINLVFNSGVDHLNIFFDAEKVEKILINLISNAVKYTNSGGNIVVSTEIKSKRVYVTVKDDGIGISANNADRIFSRFYKIENNAANDAVGTGVSLALTKELVELHKGQIRVNTGHGRGAAFTFWLHLDDMVYKPLEKVDQSRLTFSFRPVIEDIKSSPAAADYFEKQIILLVEDNLDMRRFVTSLLDENYAIVETVNGPEGFQKAKEVIPDIIISDVMMPEMDGYEFCKLIKTDNLTSHIPVILLTTKAVTEKNSEGIESGADDFIAKPFNKLELLVRIKNLLTARKLLRDKIRNELLSGFKLAGHTDSGLSKTDKLFIENVVGIVENNYSDPDFDIEHLCNLTGLSQTQLRRKMSALIAKSPVEFIRSYRLNTAARLINEGGKSVSEAAFSTGFSNLSYFTKCFKQEFGRLPNETPRY